MLIIHHHPVQYPGITQTTMIQGSHRCVSVLSYELGTNDKKGKNSKESFQEHKNLDCENVNSENIVGKNVECTLAFFNRPANDLNF